MTAPGSYERAQLAGIAALVAVAREQAAARQALPATLPLPRLPDDQYAQLEAEADGPLPLIPCPRSRGRVA